MFDVLKFQNVRDTQSTQGPQTRKQNSTAWYCYYTITCEDALCTMFYNSCVMVWIVGSSLTGNPSTRTLHVQHVASRNGFNELIRTTAWYRQSTRTHDT